MAGTPNLFHFTLTKASAPAFVRYMQAMPPVAGLVQQLGSLAAPPSLQTPWRAVLADAAGVEDAMAAETAAAKALDVKAFDAALQRLYTAKGRIGPDLLQAGLRIPPTAGCIGYFSR